MGVIEPTRQGLKYQLGVIRKRLSLWLRRPNRFPGLEIMVAAIAVIIGLSSYAILTGRHAPAEGFSPQTVTLLLVANLAPLLALLVLIARRVAILIGNRRANIAGAHLHVRLTALFAALAAAPTIIVVIFASLLFQFGVQFWFSDRARTVLDNADRVAQAYVDENKDRILDDIIAMGRDIAAYRHDFGLKSQSFKDGLAFQVAARNLSEAAVFTYHDDGFEVYASDSFDSPPLVERTSDINLAGITPGQGVVVASARDRVEAVVHLQGPGNAPLFLYASRRVEPRVLEQVARTQSALSDYNALTERSRSLQWTFNTILLVASLLIVAAAIWFAILLASRIVAPIGALAKAAERVGTGDLDAQVPVTGSDEISALARSFNRMTAELKAQQTALRTANMQSEERRRFIEAVLAGVSAGVMSIDNEGVIIIANASAEALLERGPDGLTGHRLQHVVPEFSDLLESAQSDGIVGTEITRVRTHEDRGRETQTLVVRLSSDGGSSDGAKTRNHILTFDDISQQLADQRRAAWADVARRIAHEIKNPLTPISLAAERLKRRFGAKVEDDRSTFDKLTDTIVRQVGDLRRMVDEFSAFARMPTPIFHKESIVEIVQQTLFLVEVGSSDIKFSFEADPDISPFICDRRQIGQAIVNLLKNASEAILATEKEGQIDIRITELDDRLRVSIADTGCGIADTLQERLFEPYVTTRQKGTGLGLAIVKRIVEDHHGQLTIQNRPGGGAEARMDFDLAANRLLAHGLAADDTAKSVTEEEAGQ